MEIFNTDHVLAGNIPVGDDRCRFDFNILEDKVKSLVEQQLGDEHHVMSAKPKPPKIPIQCRTFVVAQMAGNVNAPPTILRSYNAEGVSRSKCTIWEAARATTAAPSFFKPMTIDYPPPIKYVDGGLGYNNPANLALVEAQRIWNSKREVCLVSIGTGQQSAVTSRTYVCSHFNSFIAPFSLFSSYQLLYRLCLVLSLCSVLLCEPTPSCNFALSLRSTSLFCSRVPTLSAVVASPLTVLIAQSYSARFSRPHHLF